MNLPSLRTMSLAEAAECCGQMHWNGHALEQCGTAFDATCDNCPLLIERKRDEVMLAARAL